VNVREIKEKLILSLIGIAIASLWGLYATLSGFNLYDFVTNPVVLSIGLFLLIPLSFIFAEIVWKSK
jgi:uncharacterized membrane protein